MRFAYVMIFVKITYFFLPSFYFAAGHLTGFAAAACCWLRFLNSNVRWRTFLSSRSFRFVGGRLICFGLVNCQTPVCLNSIFCSFFFASSALGGSTKVCAVKGEFSALNSTTFYGLIISMKSRNTRSEIG